MTRFLVTPSRESSSGGYVISVHGRLSRDAVRWTDHKGLIHYSPFGPTTGGGTRYYAMCVRGRSFGLIRLGRRLEELREHADVDRAAATAAIEKGHEDTIRSYEDGVRLIGKLELSVLAMFYRCSAKETAELKELWEYAKQPGAFASMGLPESVVTYLNLERAAVEVRTFHNLIIPGMLQTEPYMRRLFELTNVRPNVIDQRVRARLKRQERLRSSENAPDPLHLIAVIAEEALHRCMRGPEGPDQLAALIEFASLENVQIQVMDLDAGLHAGIDGEFTCLKFAEGTVDDLVYQETASGGQITGAVAVVESLGIRFDELRSQALGADESLTRIAQLAERQTHKVGEVHNGHDDLRYLEEV